MFASVSYATFVKKKGYLWLTPSNFTLHQLNAFGRHGGARIQGFNLIKTKAF